MKQFGSYRVDRRLATGGMSEVYLATWHHGTAERPVVVKRILSHLAEDDEFLRMFDEEARLSVLMSHPNIVQIFDAGEKGGSPYLVMEYVEGCSLKQLIERNGPLSIPETLGIGIELARALYYAHTRPEPVIHRDVSPHNVLVSRDGYVKLTDFGIAKAASAPKYTKTGMVKGKLAYMAPEQLKTGKASPEADQYALGLTLYECLTGQRAVPEGSDYELMQTVVRGKWQRRDTAWKRVPRKMRKVVERMLADKPSQRWPDLRAVDAALRRAGGKALLHCWEEEVADRMAEVAADATESDGLETDVNQVSGEAQVAEENIAEKTEEETVLAEETTLWQGHTALRRFVVWLGVGFLAVGAGGILYWFAARRLEGLEFPPQWTTPMIDEILRQWGKLFPGG